MKTLSRLFCLLSLLLLVGCAHRETVPQVSVRPNTSGLKSGAFEFRPAHYFLGYSGNDPVTGKPFGPDVPPGVYASVERTNPLRVKGSRYMISPPRDGWRW
jgi:hypothetical protein